MKLLNNKQQTLPDDSQFVDEKFNTSIKEDQLKTEFVIKNGQLRNPVLSVHGRIGEEFVKLKDDDIQEYESIRKFQENGLSTNKNIKKFDCWDQDLTPEEWMAKIKEQNLDIDAQVPIYDESKNYTWTNVKVLEYNKTIDKYRVQMIKNGNEKLIGRLSLRFHIEDPIRFQQRVEIAKQRQKNADDELRFFQYVNSIDSKLSGEMLEKTKLKIEKKTLLKNITLPLPIQKIFFEMMQ